MKPNIDQFICASFSYKTTPLAVREMLHRNFNDRWAELRADFSDPHRADSLPAGISEMALLATCGRVEVIITVAPNLSDPLAPLKSLLETWAGRPWSELDSWVKFSRGEAAITYLAGVAAGLESKILGEPQILGQFNRAAEQQLPPQQRNGLLAELLRCIVRTGKQVHAETDLSRRSLSMSAVAVSMLAHALPHNGARSVLVIGAGEMARLALKALAAQQFTQVTIVNRSIGVAQELANQFGFRAAGFESLPRLLLQNEGVISATAAPAPLITGEMVEKLPHRPSFLIDLGVPPNVEPSVGQLAGVTLIDVDHLRTDVDQSLAGRRAEIPLAQAIIKEMRPQIEEVLHQLTVRPLISGWRQQIELIRRQEVSRSRQLLGEIDPVVAEQLDHLSRALVNKMFHQPTQRLRQLPPDKTAEVADALQALFGADQPRGGVQ